MIAKIAVPCTGCKYCTEKCPMELNIPNLLENYNDYAFNPEAFPHVPRRISLLPEEKRPSACIGCRSCEAVCPQNIKISEAMQNFAAKLKG